MTGSLSLTVVFEGGTATIGGNIVVLRAEKRDTIFQYLLDFGVCIDAYRPQRRLSSLPSSIEDFQRRGLIREFDMKSRACFISHAHIDHCIALPALVRSKYRPEAIWASKTTSHLIGGVTFVRKPFHLDPFGVGDYYEDPNAKEAGIEIKVALFPVDHDMPGACCYFIMVDDSLVIYTGDFRDHGFLSGTLKKQFWKYTRELRSRNKIRSCTVICEGTNYGLPFDFRPQEDFNERLEDILDHYAKELVALTINQNGLWDLFSAIQITKESEAGKSRQVIISKDLAGFIDKVRNGFSDDYRNVVTEEGLDLFRTMMGRRRFEVYDQARGNSIELLRTIAKNPSDYILFLTRNDVFNALEKIALFSATVGGCCILSFSTNEGTSDSITRTFAENICRLGFCVEKTNALARGHVSPHKLVDILTCMEPTRVFTMHTLAPKGLKSFLEAHLKCEVISPASGVPYKI